MPTPHDALFKHTFSQPEHAASLLRSVVPEPLLRKLELSTLQLVPGSFVDAAPAERHPRLSFLLDDLSALAPETPGRREGTVERLITEALLARGRGAARLEDILADPLELFSRLLGRPGGLDAVLAFLRYLLLVTELESAALERFARQLGPPAEEAFMTTAEKLRWRESHGEGPRARPTCSCAC